MMAYHRTSTNAEVLRPEIWRPYIEHQLKQGGDIKHSIIYHWKKLASVKVRNRGLQCSNKVPPQRGFRLDYRALCCHLRGDRDVGKFTCRLAFVSEVLGVEAKSEMAAQGVVMM